MRLPLLYRSTFLACLIGSALSGSRTVRADEPGAGKAAAEKVATPTTPPSPSDKPASEPAPEPAPVLLHKVSAEAQGAQTPDDPEAQKHLDKSAEELEAVRHAEQKAGLVPQTPGRGPRDSLGLGLGPGDPLMRDVEAALGVSIDGAPSADPVPSPGSPVALPELAGISEGELRAKYDIPVELNEAVVAYIRFFQTDAREHFAHWLARSARWTPLMRPILDANKVPDDLVYLSMIESGYNPYAYSFAKAAGLWQFVVGTSRRYGLTTDFWVDERRDPILSTEAAGRYLSDLKDRYHGNWYLAWAGYNAGEGKVDKAIRLESTVDFWRMMSKGRTLRAETKHYVPKLIAAALISKHPERFGFHVDYEPLFTFDTVHVDKATSLTAIAKAANTDVDMIRELNPALRRFCTPPSGWNVRIPAGSKEAFVAAFGAIKAEDRLSFAQHKIERGESLSRIAKAYGISEQAILRTNGLTKPKQFVVGHTVMIPLQGSHGLLAGEQLEERVRGRAPGRTIHDLTAGRAVTGRPSAVYAQIEEARAKAAADGKTDPADDVNARALAEQEEEDRQAAAKHGKHKRTAAVKSRHTKAGTYKVKPGDTLSSIANKMGTTVDTLQRANGLSGKKAHSLHVGQTLAIR
jgi:membrane-bound lytic murein transglycosylase D